MTKKANSNSIEPNLFGFTHVIPAQAGIQVLLLEAGSRPPEAVSQNEPNFFKAKTSILSQNRRNGGQKVR
jgi:hypothetical protein